MGIVMRGRRWIAPTTLLMEIRSAAAIGRASPCSTFCARGLGFLFLSSTILLGFGAMDCYNGIMRSIAFPPSVAMKGAGSGQGSAKQASRKGLTTTGVFYMRKFSANDLKENRLKIDSLICSGSKLNKGSHYKGNSIRVLLEEDVTHPIGSIILQVINNTDANLAKQDTMCMNVTTISGFGSSKVDADSLVVGTRTSAAKVIIACSGHQICLSPVPYYYF
ncbi:hypothetical protein Ddc_00512 [Ditylenchus destructor]|nr:hypothetical protein Ddc_00512 [Ditylenchus destructor]